MRLILSNEEARVLRMAVSHELNDNGYCRCRAESPSLVDQLQRDRETLESLRAKLS
ncbi:MAG: hypothetical protein IJ144_05890 [Prevotella sp.]|nr:hypothetical protein [Prevotella sp.]